MAPALALDSTLMCSMQPDPCGGNFTILYLANEISPALGEQFIFYNSTENPGGYYLCCDTDFPLDVLYDYSTRTSDNYLPPSIGAWSLAVESQSGARDRATGAALCGAGTAELG